ncbi:hypothetical protein DM01DRAFT_1294254 [Hesseltinella vesiculosa]|uniref:Uncharacterized protein n=1 Tax=Hesseltinella vesiculosa TaxID=101127 RepID=A0A1X2G5Z5_9FUNG|nr:hypothetical protein DM01DRAFT_1294254 [Hesseltinella vesiculosa]
MVGFTVWCQENNVGFISAPISRKRKHGVSSRIRKLYVLKNEYFADMVKNIVMFLSNYQANIKKLKEQGYEIIGYARKSPGEHIKKRLNMLS